MWKDLQEEMDGQGKRKKKNLLAETSEDPQCVYRPNIRRT